MLIQVPEISGFSVELGHDDESDPFDFDHVTDLIGVFTGLEYQAACGEVTRRRISIKKLSHSHLHAFCHERNAPRTFAMERIRAFYDLDGQIYSVTEFLELFATSADFRETMRAGQHDVGEVLRNQWRREISILAALSACDGLMLSVEVDEIVQYVGIEADDFGLRYSGGDLNRLGEVIRRMKVTESEAFEQICYLARTKKAPELKRLVAAMERVACADGILHEAEFKFFLEAKNLLS